MISIPPGSKQTMVTTHSRIGMSGLRKSQRTGTLPPREAPDGRSTVYPFREGGEVSGHAPPAVLVTEFAGNSETDQLVNEEVRVILHFAIFLTDMHQVMCLSVLYGQSFFLYLKHTILSIFYRILTGDRVTLKLSYSSL